MELCRNEDLMCIVGLDAMIKSISHEEKNERRKEEKFSFFFSFLINEGSSGKSNRGTLPRL